MLSRAVEERDDRGPGQRLRATPYGSALRAVQRATALRAVQRATALHTILCAAVLTSTLLTAAVLAGTEGTAAAVAAHGTSVHFRVEARGTDSARRGDQVVVYGKRGVITGTVTGVPRGAKIVLWSEAFPFRAATFGGRRVARTAANGAFALTVRPAVATRYEVSLFGHRAVHSGPVMLYVVADAGPYRFASSQGCSAPAPTACRLTARQTLVLPPRVAAAEVAKPVHVYLGVRLVHSPRASYTQPPARLRLDPSGRVRFTARGDRGHYLSTASFVYRVSPQFKATGWHASWSFEWCTRETFHRDGFGLPYHYACGSPSLPDTSLDLRSLG